MNNSLRVLRIINTLSIDVALGAVCCAAWFAKGFQAQLRPYAYITLGLTVWAIYTTDHLIDASKIKHDASTHRHRFHQKHFKVLIACLVLAVIADFVLLFFIKLKVLYAGLALFLIVVVYLSVNRWLSFVKEFVIAAVYCSGVLLPALVQKEAPLTVSDFLWIACFFFTTIINLILFSGYDIHSDRADSNNSFVLTFGEVSTRKVLIVLFSLQAVLIITLCGMSMWTAAAVMLAMNGTLLLLFSKPTLFGEFDVHRLYGDVIFMFPAVLLLGW
jgi:4-hydroxybenzoate polyprenyltransferase